MLKNERTNQKQNQMIPGIIFGVLGAFAFFLLITLLISWLIMEGVLSESNYIIPSVIGIGFSSFIGSIIASMKAKGKHAIIGAVTTLSWLMILFMCNILFFEGSFRAALPVTAAIIVGGGVGVLVCLRLGAVNTRNKKASLVKLYKKSRR